MTAPELRAYQRDVIANFDARVSAGCRRIIAVAPTGAGKTVIGANIIKKYVDAYKDVLVLAHRREIITQTSAKLFANDISHGIIQAGFQGRPLERVQVASIQTLHRRAIYSDSSNCRALISWSLTNVTIRRRGRIEKSSSRIGTPSCSD